MMSLLSRLFGTAKPSGEALAPGEIGQQRTPCPTCERQVLPGSHCPFCHSQSFSKQVFDTLPREHSPQEKLEALGGVIIAHEAARQYGAKGFLHVYQGKNRGETVLLATQVVTIGRDATSNQLGLNDGNVSAKHCEVRPAGASFELVDLEAKNGTFLNEVAVKRSALANGDVIALGETRIYLGLA
jgi:hypothetical protein